MCAFFGVGGNLTIGCVHNLTSLIKGCQMLVVDDVGQGWPACEDILRGSPRSVIAVIVLRGCLLFGKLKYKYCLLNSLSRVDT